MQARPRAPSGTAASNSAENFTPAHQQRLSPASSPQWFTCPHNGQRRGSVVERGWDMSELGGRAAWLVVVSLAYGALIIPLAWRHAPPPAPPQAPPAHDRLPDFSTLEGVARKRAFFAFLLPIVEARNDAILDQRGRLARLRARLHTGRPLATSDRAWLARLAREYRLAGRLDDARQLADALWSRVDIVPAPLVLVQAAKESGWGTSRFARDGNNLFGQWCYRRGCGLVPRARAPGSTHEVRVFPSIDEAVAAYLHNLNTHPAYEAFRKRRADLRDSGRPLRAEALVGALAAYSERRGAYVEEVRDMLRSNANIIHRLRAGA